MKKLLVFIVLCFAFLSNAQRRYEPAKLTFAKGTAFGSWGYNRTFYSKSKLHLEGDGYYYDLKKVKASDRPSELNFANYFGKGNLLSPQFSARMGYYVKNHWAVSFGVDHFKYVFNDRNEVFLDGKVSIGNQIDFGDGQLFNDGGYKNEALTTSSDKFHYENTHGLNAFALSLIRTDRWFSFGQKDQFALSSNLSGSFGLIQTVNDFRYAGLYTTKTSSLSGFTLSATMGYRFEFFRYLFFQANGNAGYVVTPRIRTRDKTVDPKAYASQYFGYVGMDLSFGFFLYIKPVNGCNTCPVW
jgi:hypothetical protein